MSQTVLVADDSKTIRKVVEMALKASEFEVVGVGSAREAVEAAQQLPAVILLDYYMPDGSGYDVCRALKGNQSTSQIPVIMLGGTYKNFDADLARSCGASLVVMKPFLTDELIDAIEAAVKGAGAAPPPPQISAAPPAPAAQPPAMDTPLPEAFSQPSQPLPPPQRSQPPAMDTPLPEAFSQPSQPLPPPQQSPPLPPPQRPQTPPAMDTPLPAGFSAPEPQAAEPTPRQPSPASGPQRMAVPPTQTPLPESQPRINVGGGSQSRISTSDSNSGVRKRQPTPASGVKPMPAGTGGGLSMSEDEVKEFIREEVKNAVREELPGLLRNVMGEVFQQKVLPKLLMHSDDKIQKSLDQQLDHRISQQVRMELERLLAEE